MIVCMLLPLYLWIGRVPDTWRLAVYVGRRGHVESDPYCLLIMLQIYRESPRYVEIQCVSW